MLLVSVATIVLLSTGCRMAVEGPAMSPVMSAAIQVGARML